MGAAETSQVIQSFRVSSTLRVQEQIWRSVPLGFSVDTDDELVAVSEAVMIFWSGLTFEEREDAAHTLEVMGHPRMLPDAPPPVR